MNLKNKSNYVILKVDFIDIYIKFIIKYFIKLKNY